MVKCPILGCAYDVSIGGYFKYTQDDVVEKLIHHVKYAHTMEEIFEWLERCMVKHVEKDGDW